MYIITPPTIYLNNDALLFTSSNAQINARPTHIYLSIAMSGKGVEMADILFVIYI